MSAAAPEARPPRARGDDVRLLRRPDREEAEPARRRRGDRQLRDRAGRRCSFDPAEARLEDLVGAVESIGYHAHVAGRPRRRRTSRPEPGLGPAPRRRRRAHGPARGRSRWSPPLQFAGWEWVALALATPVVLSGRLAFHRAALRNAAPRRRDDGHADLDRHARRLDLVDGRAASPAIDADTYFEVAAVITTLILLGRYLEARAKTALGRGDPLAARARREGGARPARRRRGARAGRGRSRVGDLLRRAAGREDRHRRRRRARASRRSTSRC